jgi:hypothetical protein
MDFAVTVWLVFAKMEVVYSLGCWLLGIGQGGSCGYVS